MSGATAGGEQTALVVTSPAATPAPNVAQVAESKRSFEAQVVAKFIDNPSSTSRALTATKIRAILGCLRDYHYAAGDVGYFPKTKEHRNWYNTYTRLVVNNTEYLLHGKLKKVEEGAPILNPISNPTPSTLNSRP
jgi:hypothetical protein